MLGHVHVQLSLAVLMLCVLGCTAQPFQPDTGFVPLGARQLMFRVAEHFRYTFIESLSISVPAHHY